MKLREGNCSLPVFCFRQQLARLTSRLDPEPLVKTPCSYARGITENVTK
jgi:hypothetical protein